MYRRGFKAAAGSTAVCSKAGLGALTLSRGNCWCWRWELEDKSPKASRLFEGAYLEQVSGSHLTSGASVSPTARLKDWIQGYFRLEESSLILWFGAGENLEFSLSLVQNLAVFAHQHLRWKVGIQREKQSPGGLLSPVCLTCPSGPQAQTIQSLPTGAGPSGTQRDRGEDPCSFVDFSPVNISIQPLAQPWLQFPARGCASAPHRPPAVCKHRLPSHWPPCSDKRVWTVKVRGRFGSTIIKHLRDNQHFLQVLGPLNYPYLLKNI